MQILNVHVCVYVIGPDHSQVNSGQGRVPVSNDIVSSPGAEGSPARSEVSPGQIATDTVNAAESSSQLERPAPAVDNASEPAQPSAGAAGKLSLPDTEPVGDDIQRVQEGSSSQAIQPQTGGVDDHNQQVKQGSTSETSEPAPSTSPVVVDPVAKSETHSQHNADSEATPSVDDETVVNDDSSSSQSQSVDQHDVHAGKPVDSQSDSSAEHDHSPPVNDTEPSVGLDDDNVIHPLHTGEPVDEEIDQLMDEMTESTGDEPHSVDMDDSVDKELSARDNTDVKNLKEVITEQLTADDDKDDGDNYLSPVIGLWTPVDVWLMTCIDSVSI